MARPTYTVAPEAKFWDGMVMHEAGETGIPYDGEPGDNLIPENAEAKARKKMVGKPVQPLDKNERAELEAFRAAKAEAEAAKKD